MATHLIHVGFGNYASADQMIGVASPNAAPIKRMVQIGRKDRITIDMTSGKRTKSVLFMTNGSIVLSALTPRAIAGRTTAPAAGDEE